MTGAIFISEDADDAEKLAYRPGCVGFWAVFGL